MKCYLKTENGCLKTQTKHPLSIKRGSNMTVQVFCDNNRMCRKNIKLRIKKSYIYIYIYFLRERERERESRQGEVRWDEIASFDFFI